jgi:hypothetical protein
MDTPELQESPPKLSISQLLNFLLDQIGSLLDNSGIALNE